MKSLNLCFAKNTAVDDSNFVLNRLLMLHPTRAVILSKDFEADVEHINIK